MAVYNEWQSVTIGEMWSVCEYTSWSWDVYQVFWLHWCIVGWTVELSCMLVKKTVRKRELSIEKCKLANVCLCLYAHVHNSVVLCVLCVCVCVCVCVCDGCCPCQNTCCLLPSPLSFFLSLDTSSIHTHTHMHAYCIKRSHTHLETHLDVIPRTYMRPHTHTHAHTARDLVVMSPLYIVRWI